MMKTTLSIFHVVALACCLALASNATAGLTLINSFATPATFSGPDGIAFHPTSGNLFVVDSSSESVTELPPLARK